MSWAFCSLQLGMGDTEILLLRLSQLLFALKELSAIKCKLQLLLWDCPRMGMAMC